ncbi:unnamed protein product [Moneuplotes crassus]|uniref:Uncharacterized protein n=1 Tax=Euplotes crassus TaxID=5936 RepID=A0AAD2D2G0_EUPCR|nr:unnamed protein product [Moneuplotes crassus]
MSIYSGFATRNQEEFYNKLVQKLISMMSDKIIADLKGKSLPDEHSWSKSITKIHKTLAYMEQAKYLEPKFSYCFDDLTALLLRSGNISDSTRMSRISAVDRIQTKMKNFKSLPISPKGLKHKIRNKNGNNKAVLKFLATSEIASSPNIETSSITAEENRNVTSTKRGKMPVLVPEIKNIKKSRKKHNNSQIPNHIGLEEIKREKLSSTRYWRSKPTTSFSKKHSANDQYYYVSKKFRIDKGYQKSTSGNSLLRKTSITLRDSNLGKVKFGGRIKPIKLQHHIRPKR